MLWKFSIQGAPVLMPPLSIQADITVTDRHTNVTQQLRMLSPFSAHKTLGHYKKVPSVVLHSYGSTR